MVILRKVNAYDRDEASRLSAFVCHTPSRTQQSQVEESDINVIVRRFGVTGQLPQGVRVPAYADFTGAGDFRQAMDAILAAKISFGAMPAETRARFQNDPQLFLEFCSDEANLEEMRRMGLAVPKKAPGDSASAGASGDAGTSAAPSG